MSKVTSYFETIFPAALVLRLVRDTDGGVATRHVSVSRAPSFYCHFKKTVFTKPSDLVALMVFEHDEDENGHAVRRKPARPWYCTTLHISWSTIEHQPLIVDGLTLDPGHLDREHFEIVFDFDLPELDTLAATRGFPIRKGFLCCCANSLNSGCCKRCWLLIRLVRRVISYLAPREWGPALWTYSGGKGAHCLFGSPEARALPLQVRRHFHEAYMAMVGGIAKIPESLAQSLLATWEELGIQEQKILASEAACTILVDCFLNGRQSRHGMTFMTVLTKTKDSKLRWDAFKRLAGPEVALKVACSLGLVPIDPNPLKNREASIKCPFSLHMTSQRVALPLPDHDFEAFDPLQSPSLRLSPEKLASCLTSSVSYFQQWLDANKYAS